MVTKTSKEDVDAALKEQLRKDEGQKEQVEKRARRPKKNTEEITQMTKLVMVGEIQKIFEQAMLIIRDFLTSDTQVLAINIKGPTGVGKTSLVFYMAEQLGRELNMRVPFELAQCNQAQDYHELLGYQKIAYEGDKLTTQFVDGPILKAIKAANEYGIAILLLDEVNGLAPEAQKLVNPLLDGRSMVKYGDIEAKIYKGKKLIVIGTMNELQSGYYGISPLNLDLERRFEYTFILPYPNPEDEFEIIDKMVGGNTESSIIKAAIKLANHTRDGGKWEGPPISTPMLIAFISAFEKFSKSNIPNALMEAFEVSILNHFDEQLRKALIEKAVDVGLLPPEDKKNNEW
ncbi:MAG: MoxR family ATPase [Candidatus Micrarchaeota archaeon]